MINEDWDHMIRFVRDRLDQIEKHGDEGWLQGVVDPGRDYLLLNFHQLVSLLELRLKTQDLHVEAECCGCHHELAGNDVLKGLVFSFALKWNEHPDFLGFWKDAHA